MVLTSRELFARAKLSQHYTLPSAVKLALDADIQQGNSMAIVMALFAAALVSLAQLIAAVDKSTNTATPAWEALRFFTYSSIILNLSGAFLSLMIIKMCSDLPLAAQQKLLDAGDADPANLPGFTFPPTKQRENTPRIASSVPPDIFDPDWIDTNDWNIPLAVAQERILLPEILKDHFRLLESFGMSKKYRIVDRTSSIVLLVACVCTFTAMSLWTFLSEAIITAGVTMVVFGGTSVVLLTVYLIGNLRQGWQ